MDGLSIKNLLNLPQTFARPNLDHLRMRIARAAGAPTIASQLACTSTRAMLRTMAAKVASIRAYDPLQNLLPALFRIMAPRSLPVLDPAKEP